MNIKIKKPCRATRTFTQHLVAEPSRVFPLLCPVREADWIEGWNPVSIISESGIAEPDCVFVTVATPHDAVWFVSRHEPDAGFIEMIKITPEFTACKLSIRLAPFSVGTDSTVTYSHTSLGPEGDVFVAGFTEDYYAQFMRGWESCCVIQSHIPASISRITPIPRLKRTAQSMVTSAPAISIFRTSRA